MTAQPERTWGDGTRWCIRKRPNMARMGYPWVVVMSVNRDINYTSPALRRFAEAIWRARIEHGMTDGLVTDDVVEIGRFRKYEHARAAFAAADTTPICPACGYRVDHGALGCPYAVRAETFIPRREAS